MTGHETLLRHEQVYIENSSNPELPVSHRDDYARAIAIASMVGEELDNKGNKFDFTIVHNAEEIGEVPKINLFENDFIGLDRYQEIDEVNFEANPKSLSGRVDAAHAVLPGVLTVSYENSGPEENVNIPVVIKGSFKREFSDRFERLRKEIKISQLQRESGEIAFQPIAAVIAPPVNPGGRSRVPQNEILLLTLYEESAVSMDNAPWSLGFTEDNLEAAERAAAAIGRFNRTIGLHGDAKIKNIVQKPDGSTSMIDFETSEIRPIDDPVEARHIVSIDLGLFFDSLSERGFLSSEPWRALEVLEALADAYLAQWKDVSEEVEEAIYDEVVEVVEHYRGYSAERLAKSKFKEVA